MVRKAVLLGSIVVSVFGMAVVGLAEPVGAQETEIVIELDGVATGEEGSVLELVNRPVDASLVGATCSVSGRTENNESVHPGNDIIIASGDSVAEVPNVEELENEIIAGTGTVTLGDSIIVSIRFGPDEVTSGGIFLDFVCQPAAPEEGPETGAGGTAGGGGVAPWVAVVGIAALAGGGALVVWRKRPATGG
jgi:hypothetical protein